MVLVLVLVLTFRAHTMKLCFSVDEFWFLKANKKTQLLKSLKLNLNLVISLPPPLLLPL